MGRAPRKRQKHIAATLALGLLSTSFGCVREKPLASPPAPPVLAEVTPVDPVTEPTAEPEPLSDAPAILSSLCVPIWAVHEDGGRRIACTKRGPYNVKPSSSPVVVDEHRGDPTEVCELISMARGSFTKADTKQLLLGFAECGGKAPSAVVAEETDGTYRQVVFENDIAIEHCEKTRRPDHRDILYCEQRVTVEHVGTSTGYVVADFAHVGRHVGVVANLMQNAFDCAFFQTNAVNTMPKGYVWARSTFRTDAGKLLVGVERRFGAPSAQLDGRLGSECQKNIATDGLDVLPPAELWTIAIEPRGDTYAPTPESKQLLDGWTREMNDPRLRPKTPTVWISGKK